MLLVEDMPAEERIRKGNVMFKHARRATSRTRVAQLVHDEDQSMAAAAAIQLVEERGLWSLADDLEHVLAHRDVQRLVRVRSGIVGAGRAADAGRSAGRALWQEPLPAVELAERLRRIQLFDFASVDELFRIAGLGRQVRHEAGRVALRARRDAAERCSSCSTDGCVATAATGATETFEAPAPLAFEEVLEGTPMRGHHQRRSNRASPCR